MVWILWRSSSFERFKNLCLLLYLSSIYLWFGTGIYQCNQSNHRNRWRIVRMNIDFRWNLKNDFCFRIAASGKGVGIVILILFLSFIISSGAARFERSENRASSSERSEDERSERSHCKTSIRFFSCKMFHKIGAMLYRTSVLWKVHAKCFTSLPDFGFSLPNFGLL